MSPDALADLVEALLDERGWSQARLHRASGLAESTIIKILRGEVARSDTLRKLDRGFALLPGTSAAVLAGELDADAGVQRGSSRQTPDASPTGFFAADQVTAEYSSGAVDPKTRRQTELKAALAVANVAAEYNLRAHADDDDLGADFVISRDGIPVGGLWR